MVWQRLIRRWTNQGERAAKKQRRRRLLMESLTKRELLASDLGAVSGTAFTDVAGNGTFDAGTDPVLSGVQVQIFEDTNTNGVFNAGTDTLLNTTNTDANGVYRFDGLSPGVHFVQQAAVAGQTAPQIATVTVVNDAGNRVALIDDFALTTQSVTATSGSTTANDSAAATEVIGGERDVVVNNTNAQGQVTVFVDDATDQLSIGSLGDAVGNALIQYDGADGNTSLNATGLGGVSLAGDNPGDPLDPAASLIVQTRAENAGDNLTIRIFTNATNFSEFTLAIPVDAANFQEVVVPLSNFAQGGGAAGPADFNDVGAIEAAIGLSANNDVFANIVESIEPEIVVSNLPNTQLLSLGGIVFEDNNAGADQNDGELDAGEAGIGGVAVQLFGNGNLDPTTDTPIATVNTAPDGRYVFPDLEPGDYLTFIPNSQLANGQALFGFENSTGNDPAPDPDNDVDGDDNGREVGGVGFSSGVITLLSNSEPVNDDDTDPNTNTTLDFGFFPEIDLTITKDVNVAASNVQAGGNVVFDVVVSNLGPADATGVTVTDVIPNGLTFDAATSSFNGNTFSIVGTTLTVTVGNLAAGNNVNFQIGTQIAGNQATDLVNTASVVGAEVETDPDNNADDASVDLTFADLVIEKTDVTDPINAGTQETYTITVTNNGPDAAQDVTITDNLPDDTTFVRVDFLNGTGTPTENPAGSGDLEIAVGDIPNGGIVSFNVVVDVSQTATSPLNNVASVVANPDNDPIPGNNSTNEETIVLRQVDLTIDKGVTGTPIAGENVTYSVTATNTGPGVARDVQVTDVLDNLLTFVAGSFNAGTSGVTINQAGQNLTFDVGTLNVNDSVTFSFDVAIDSSATGVIPNEAEVITSDIETDNTNNTDNVDITVQNQVDLILTKSVDLATAVAGQDTVVYTFNISHDTDSPSDAANVVFTDVLPEGLTGVQIGDVGDGQASFDTATRTATVNFASIPVGTTRSFTITANVNEDATGTLVNPASIAVPNDIDTSNNNDDAQTVINPQFDVTIAKDVNDATPQPGDDVTYTVQLTNSGPSTATGVVLTDDIPAGLTFTSGTLNGQNATVNANEVTFQAITLASGATATATLNFSVSDTADGQIINTATVTADAGETNLNNNSDPADITVTPEVDITVVKSVDQASAQVNDTLVYSVTVSNSGPSTAVDVTATDTLPAGVSFVSGSGPNGEALTANNGVVVVNGGNLASGGSFSFTINATINAGVTAAQTNRVDVATTTAETNLNNNSATAVTTIDPVTSSIAGTVYVDANANGVQDAGETGIAGVTLTLSGSDNQGNPVSATATTDANGDYLFANLAAGTYTVNETQPAGFRDGQEAAGQNATASVGDDVFTQLGLGEDTDAVNFDFGELAESLSKRRFLASS